jgi:uncharacterized membrane protein YfcA
MPEDNAFSWATAGAVFCTYALIDVLYARWVICVGERKAVTAAFMTAAIYSLLAFGVLTYSKNVAYVIPLAAGAFLGTYFTVRLSPDSERREGP